MAPAWKKPLPSQYGTKILHAEWQGQENSKIKHTHAHKTKNPWDYEKEGRVGVDRQKRERFVV